MQSSILVVGTVLVVHRRQPANRSGGSTLVVLALVVATCSVAHLCVALSYLALQHQAQVTPRIRVLHLDLRYDFAQRNPSVLV